MPFLNAITSRIRSYRENQRQASLERRRLQSEAARNNIDLNELIEARSREISRAREEITARRERENASRQAEDRTWRGNNVSFTFDYYYDQNNYVTRDSSNRTISELIDEDNRRQELQTRQELERRALLSRNYEQFIFAPWNENNIGNFHVDINNYKYDYGYDDKLLKDFSGSIGGNVRGSRYEFKVEKRIALVKERNKLLDELYRIKRINRNRYKDLSNDGNYSQKVKKIKDKLARLNPYIYVVKLRKKKQKGENIGIIFVKEYKDIIGKLKELKNNCEEELRNSRKLARKVKLECINRTIGDCHYDIYRVGGLIVSEATVNKLFTCDEINIKDFDTPLRKYKRILFEEINRCYCRSKSPQNDNKHVGVEIEFITDASKDTVIEQLYENDPKTKSYCYIKYDCSIKHKPYGYGHEICIIGEESNIKDRVKTVCNVLNNKKIKAAINTSCGLHVHLDVRDMETPELNKMWTSLCNWEEALFDFQPRSRNENKYCVKVSGDRTKPDLCSERRTGLNCKAIRQHGTIEIRMHSATTNYRKINNWITLLLAIKTVGAEIKIKKKERFFLSCEEALLKYLKLNRETAAYFVKRAKDFNNYEEKYESLFSKKPEENEEAIQARMIVNSDVYRENCDLDEDHPDYPDVPYGACNLEESTPF